MDQNKRIYGVLALGILFVLQMTLLLIVGPSSNDCDAWVILFCGSCVPKSPDDILTESVVGIVFGILGVIMIIGSIISIVKRRQKQILS